MLPFKMRLFQRVSIFCFKILNNQILEDFNKNLEPNNDVTVKLRHRDIDLVVVHTHNLSSGHRRLGYFLPRMVNIVIRNSYVLNKNEFLNDLKTNIMLKFSLFSNNLKKK